MSIVKYEEPNLLAMCIQVVDQYKKGHQPCHDMLLRLKDAIEREEAK